MQQQANSELRYWFVSIPRWWYNIWSIKCEGTFQSLNFCCTNWFYLKSGVHNHPARVKFHPLFEPAKLDVELIKVLSAKRMSSGFFLDKLSHLSCPVYCPHIFTFFGGWRCCQRWWWCKINFCGDCDPAWPRGADPPWDPSSSHTTLLDFPVVRSTLGVIIVIIIIIIIMTVRNHHHQHHLAPRSSISPRSGRHWASFQTVSGV